MTDTPAPPAIHQVEITRDFDFPRELVFAAWTDPTQLSKWFGPDGFNVPRDEMRVEPQVGGRYELPMVQEGTGTTHPANWDVIEVVEPELLVMRSDPMPEYGLHEGTVTRVEFHEHDGGTRLVLSDGPYPEPMGGGAQTGWEQSFTKLEAALSS